VGLQRAGSYWFIACWWGYLYCRKLNARADVECCKGDLISWYGFLKANKKARIERCGPFYCGLTG
jgi:hypothetical protein